MPRRGADGKQLPGSAKLKNQIEQLESTKGYPPDWSKKQLASYRRAVRGLSGAERDLAALKWASDWAAADIYGPPSAARQQVIAASQSRGKLADPIKKLEEAMAVIAQQAERIEMLEALLRGRSAQSIGNPRPSASAAIQ